MTDLPPRISLITLGARDVTALSEFYESLGWRKSSDSVRGEVSFFDTAGSRLAIYSLEDLSRDVHEEVPEPKAFSGITLAINLASTAEVDFAIAAATKAGGLVVTPPIETDWGGYNAHFADPEGNVWEVAFNPGWPLGEDTLPQLP